MSQKDIVNERVMVKANQDDDDDDPSSWVRTSELTQDARDARVAQTWAALVDGEEDSLYDLGIPQRDAPGYADLLVRQSHSTHVFFFSLRFV
jgi:hypothetical protein